ncbi:MAG: thermonuclease family protein [Planctomycetota bacterium]
MSQRSLLVSGLFVVGLTLGVVVGRFSMPAAAAASGSLPEGPAILPEQNGPAAVPPAFPNTGAAGPGLTVTAAEPVTLDPAPDSAPVREITATHFEVTRVIDGDTFRVEYDGDLTSVRLLDIDAPERGDPRAAAATEEMRRLVQGQTVRLEFGSGRKRDGFGRLLCHVFVGDLNVGKHLLDLGLVGLYEPGPRRKKTP